MPPTESTPEMVAQVHDGTLKLDTGTLVEVLVGDDKYECAEVNGYENTDPIVRYLKRDDDGVHALADVSYLAPRQSINRFVKRPKGTKVAAWRLLGFHYVHSDEIIPLDDMNTSESDSDWEPGKEEAAEEEPTESDPGDDGSELSEAENEAENEAETTEESTESSDSD